MNRIILTITSLSASAALACTGAPLCFVLAPGDGLRVPANVPAFVGPPTNSATPATLTIQFRASDAGVRQLQPLDGGGGQLYAPGPLASGDFITLESNVKTCGLDVPPKAQVAVLDAAPFPTELGSVVLGEPTGFLRPQGTGADCSPEDQIPAVRRSVSVIFPDEVVPWLSVMQVRLNGSSPHFGHLVRTVTPGTPTFIGEVTADCLRTDEKHTRPVVVELRIAGRSEVLRDESMAELNCGLAPPAPAGCGCDSFPGSALALLGLWLTRRLSGSTRPRSASATAA